MADQLVLDTSAIMAFIEDEPGADQVEAVLLNASAGGLRIYGSFVSLTEIDYISRQERDELVAVQRIRDLQKLPIEWIHSDDALCSAAAKLKSVNRISFADAFVAATALRFNAVLMHKDPEFLALRTTIEQFELPPKR